MESDEAVGRRGWGVESTGSVLSIPDGISGTLKKWPSCMQGSSRKHVTYIRHTALIRDNRGVRQKCYITFTRRF